MFRFTLSAPVEIVGPNLFNQTAILTLEPVGKPGWFWHVDGIDLSIAPSIAGRGTRRLRLVHEGHVLETPEHIIALRQMGLDSVRIISSHRWPPHDGCAKALYEAVAPNIQPDGQLLRIRVRSDVSCKIDGRLTRILPYPIDRLEVHTFVNYRGVGSRQVNRTFRGGLHRDVCSARTLSVMPAPVRWILENIPENIWPHYHRTFWKGDPHPAQILREVALHRMLDMFGAFALVCPPGTTLVGTLQSIRGGHGTDMGLVEMIRVGSIELIDAA